MTIKNSTKNDIQKIFELYQLATNYQKEKFPGNQWPVFDRKLIEQEIEEKRQFKILENDTVACVWAITFSDPEIWEDKNDDPAIYIHRIATAPDFRGRNYVAEIVKWAKHFAEKKKLRFVRLDTCGNNLKLIDHYTKNGFSFLGMDKLKNSVGLPEHYQNADVCYFEIQLKKSNTPSRF